MGSRGSGSGKSAGGAASIISQLNGEPSFEKMKLSRQLNYTDIPFETPEIEPGKPTKDSEKEFNEAFRQAQSVVRTQGWQTDFALQRMQKVNNTFDTADYSPQALKGIQAKINSNRSHIGLQVRFNTITPEKATIKTQALSMVQKTLNSTIRKQREYDKRLQKKGK